MARQGPVVTGKPRRGLSDDELAAAVRWIARLWLEVERGQRPPRALRRYLAPHLAFDLERAQRPAGARPVDASDVGRARFQRLGRDKGFAVVVVRELDGSWGALTLVLRRDRAAGWRIIEVTRPPLASQGLVGRRGTQGFARAGQ